MSQRDVQVPSSEIDPPIAEVRRIRAEICARAGHDLDRLAEELRGVERDYRERKNAFAGVSAESAARVEQSWGDMAGPGDDPQLDQVRRTRDRQQTMSD